MNYEEKYKQALERATFYNSELLTDPVEEFEQMVAKVYKEGGSL